MSEIISKPHNLRDLTTCENNGIFLCFGVYGKFKQSVKILNTICTLFL